MPLTVTALGVVVGFPLLTALALQHITSARSIVFIGLLPLVDRDLRRRPWRRAAEGRRSGSSRLSAPRWSRASRLRTASPPRSPATSDGRRHRGLRPRLRGRRAPLAPPRRLAGDLVGAGALAAGHGRARPRDAAGRLDRHRRPGLARPRLRVGLQHAGRLRVLVPRPRARRHRRASASCSCSSPSSGWRSRACCSASRSHGR